jgi:predicted component of type VI protein secretion system
MTGIEHLVEQHILEYESRLKHVDELLERAHKAVEKEPSPVSEELAALKEEREKFAAHLEELRLKSLQDWREEEIEKAGPMGVWDALAQQLEKLVERFEK